MSKQKIAVLRVAELTTTATLPGAACVGMVDALKGKTHIYSTGMLEFAVEKYATYVISSRTRIAPFDRWWSNQLPNDRIILTDECSIGEEEFFKLLPWYALYKRLHLQWPGHMSLALVLANLRLHGVLLGDEVRANMAIQNNPFLDG